MEAFVVKDALMLNMKRIHENTSVNTRKEFEAVMRPKFVLTRHHQSKEMGEKTN